jgi:hypothetical protein
MNNINITKQDEKYLKLIVISLKKQEAWMKENKGAKPNVFHELFSKSHSQRYIQAMGHIKSKFGKAHLEIIKMYFSYDSLDKG